MPPSAAMGRVGANIPGMKGSPSRVGENIPGMKGRPSSPPMQRQQAPPAQRQQVRPQPKMSIPKRAPKRKATSSLSNIAGHRNMPLGEPAKTTTGAFDPSGAWAQQLQQDMSGLNQQISLFDASSSAVPKSLVKPEEFGQNLSSGQKEQMARPSTDRVYQDELSDIECRSDASVETISGRVKAEWDRGVSHNRYSALHAIKLLQQVNSTSGH